MEVSKMNGNKMLLGTLVIVNAIVAGCIQNPNTAVGSSGGEPPDNSQDASSPDGEGANGQTVGTEEVSTETEPTPAKLLSLEISIDGSDVKREVDGYSATAGAFTFKADVVPDTDLNISWYLGEDAVETGQEISHDLTEPGDYLVRAVTKDDSGQTVSDEVILRIPARETHWFMQSLTPTPVDPADMSVVILPPAYFSSGPMLGNTSWIGPNALCQHPAVQAAMEGMEYWRWFLNEGSEEFPQLSNLSWDIKTLGCNGSLSDLQNADVVIVIAMAAESLPLSQNFGMALPLDVCIAVHAGVGVYDSQPHGVRNFVIHEFGHCIGAGHSGDHTTGHCSTTYGCFDNHPSDIMSQGPPSDRRCLSNLNLVAMAEAYDWRSPISDAEWYDGEVFILKEDYRQTCMPEAMNRF